MNRTMATAVMLGTYVLIDERDPSEIARAPMRPSSKPAGFLPHERASRTPSHPSTWSNRTRRLVEKNARRRAAA